MVRKLTRRAVLASVGATMAAGAGGLAGAASKPRPNILFILADDMGVADCSCYGAPQIRTPAIDRIAAEGLLFRQAYANSAVCSASRVGIITGRYQYRLAVGLEEPLGPTHDVGLPPEHPTLPSLLRKLGYDTYLVGKWHLGSAPKFGPLKSGYDHFYGFEAGASDYFAHNALIDDGAPDCTPGYLTDLLGKRAVQIVRQHAAAPRPFFLSLHFNAPHWPWEGPGDEAESRRLNPPGGGFGHLMDYDGGTLATYTRMVESMDQQIGRVLDTLEQTGQARDTLVLFTSDNGGERFSNTWPFTGKKEELLEGGLRVPAVIRWPGLIPKSVASDQVIIHMDWLPTFLAAAGGAPDPAYPSDGMDLLPTLTQSAAPFERALYWRYKANAQRAVRKGAFKALKIQDNTFLFDVVNDPLERANLKTRRPEMYASLTAMWDAWNADMLPETAGSTTETHEGALWADHIGALPINHSAVDTGGPWPNGRESSR